MTGEVIGFVIWGIVGFLFVGLGISAIFSKKPVGFWANAEMFEVTDIKKYNGAMTKLFCIYGIVFAGDATFVRTKFTVDSYLCYWHNG